MSQTDDLVRLSGVSRSTVFRFLRGDNVRQEARTAILTAMRALNIEHEDHGVHANSTLLISIRPHFRSFQGYNQSIASFMTRAEAAGFHVQITTAGTTGIETSYSRLSRLAGVLILGKMVDEEESELKYLEARDIPYVFLNRVFHDSTTSWVSVDHRAAARDAVSHLLDLGHGEVGTWGLPAASRLESEKRAGYLDALSERGLERPVSCLDVSTHGDLESAVQTLIESRRLPGAWFAASDEHAIRFLKVARENGLAVPDDVAIVGMDDTGEAEYANPALTTVRIPYHEAGAAALVVLRNRIENPEIQAMTTVLRHRLVIRESCGSRGARNQAQGAETNEQVSHSSE